MLPRRIVDFLKTYFYLVLAHRVGSPNNNSTRVETNGSIRHTKIDILAERGSLAVAVDKQERVRAASTKASHMDVDRFLVANIYQVQQRGPVDIHVGFYSARSPASR